MIVSPPHVAEVGVALGLTLLSWDLPRRIDGLYFWCPARRLRLLLASRLLSAAGRERLLTRAVVIYSLHGECDHAELIPSEQ